MQTRVFVVDDHELVRQALTHFIGRTPSLELAGSAGTAADGAAGVAETNPDVVLLDVYLPDGTGIELCRELKSRRPDLGCIVLTGAGSEPLIEAVLAGADAFVSKEVGFQSLVETIEKVAAGERVIEKLEPRTLVELFDDRSGPGANLPALRPQEARLLELIGEGMTNREIAGELALAEQTVKNYVSNLLAKLGLERRAQAAAYAVKHGYTREA